MFLGPAPWFRISATAITQGPDGGPVAERHQLMWSFRGLSFNRFDCRQPIFIRLEDPAGETGEDLGQFEECAVVDGSMFGEGALLARWNPESGAWASADTEAEWPVLLIQAGQARRPYPLRS